MSSQSCHPLGCHFLYPCLVIPFVHLKKKQAPGSGFLKFGSGSSKKEQLRNTSVAELTCFGSSGYKKNILGRLQLQTQILAAPAPVCF